MGTKNLGSYYTQVAEEQSRVNQMSLKMFRVFGALYVRTHKQVKS